MANLAVRQVITLPGTPQPHTLYLVRSAESPLMDIYLTNSDATDVRHILTKADISSLITTSLQSYSFIEVVADITARNALNPTKNIAALVLNATGDITVAAGSAMYVWVQANTAWTKISEFESLDLTLTWASITGKPTSSVANIDDAVAKRHTHANTAVLDLLGVDGNGQLTYNNVNIGLVLAAADW